jgi:hypothetical protein
MKRLSGFTALDQKLDCCFVLIQGVYGEDFTSRCTLTNLADSNVGGVFLCDWVGAEKYLDRLCLLSG